MESTSGLNMSGYDGNVQAFYTKVIDLLTAYDPSGNWQNLVQRDSSGNILRILAPKLATDLLALIQDGVNTYLQNIFFKYFQSNPLYIKADNGSIYEGYVIPKDSTTGPYS